MPPKLEKHIGILRQRWLEDSASRDIVPCEIPRFGSELFGENQVPIRTGHDVFCQLALYLYFGKHVVPCWQPVSQAHFHDGRHDMMQLASGPVRAFCEAAAPVSDEDAVPLPRSRALMVEAARDIGRRMGVAKDGKGFQRLFAAIDHLWPADEPRASLFDDALLRRSMDFTVTNMNLASVESVTTPLDPNVLRLRYTIRAD